MECKLDLLSFLLEQGSPRYYRN